MGNTVEYSYKIWLLPGSCNLFSHFVVYRVEILKVLKILFYQAENYHFPYL
jgi:hypothetical protein